MAKDEPKSLDAVVIPTLFLGELKYSADEIACIVYFESKTKTSDDLRKDKIPKREIYIGIPIHVNLKTIGLVVERFFARAFEKGAQIFKKCKLIPNESVTEIWKLIAATYWNTSGTLKERAKESYKKAAETIKEIVKKDKKNESLLEELETFLALCVSVSENTPPLSPNVIKQILSV
ncbi:MAG: hypothetical protein ACFFCD_08730 [Promethearchaeota archaeon]